MVREKTGGWPGLLESRAAAGGAETCQLPQVLQSERPQDFRAFLGLGAYGIGGPAGSLTSYILGWHRLRNVGRRKGGAGVGRKDSGEG